jgi:hypothetical protein
MMQVCRIIVLALASCFAWCVDANSQIYILDSTYATNGFAQIKSTDSLCTMRVAGAAASVIQADHKIICLHSHYDDTDVNHLTPGLIRMMASGVSVDSSFGDYGVAQKTLLPLSATSSINYNRSSSLAIGLDGNIVVGGRKKLYAQNFYASRTISFLSNGTVDNTFGNNGVYLDSSYQTHQNFEIHTFNGSYLNLNLDVGSHSTILSRITSNGTPDLGFANNGFQLFSMYNGLFYHVDYRSVSIINNQLYICYVATDTINGIVNLHSSGFIKLKANGVPDSTYGVFGMQKTNSHLHNKFITKDGFITNINFTTAVLGNNIVTKVTDSSTQKAYICLYNTNGYIDTANFGLNGYSIFEPLPNSSATTQILRLNTLQNSMIVVLGRTLISNSPLVHHFIAIYNQYGQIDSSFGLNGYYNLNDSLATDAMFYGNILSLDSTHFYVTGDRIDTSSTNYFAGFYCIAKFKIKTINYPATIATSVPGKCRISPNPFSSFVDIQIPSTEAITSIEVYSVDGARVFASRTSSTKIDLSALPSGIYQIEVLTSSGRYFSKVEKR